MKLLIEKPYVEAMVKAYPDLSALKDQLRLGNRAEVPFDVFSSQQLGYLKDLYHEAGAGMQGQAAQIATLQQALNDDGGRFDAEDLERLLPVIADFLLNNVIRGWLFKVNAHGKPIAYLVTRLDYTPPGEEEAGRIFIELKANSRSKIETETLILRGKDIANKTVSEIFAAKSFLRETPELVRSYDETAARYFQWRSEYGKQFSAKGVGIYAEDPTASHRERDWTRKTTVVLSSTGNTARLVNDENILQDRDLTLEASGNILGKYLRKAGNSARYDCKVENQLEKSQDIIPKDAFTELPVHAYLFMFHLDLHHHVWVHTDDMEIYHYQPILKEKLVLPAEQTDLIDILTAEMDVLMDDFIEGKSGGTTVLCAGPPGVGKTLTAEVYSETIKRPLYRVHSGQLGLNVSEMEKILMQTLTRAQRWGAVMLIDEADVYIRRRDDNIAANAVVGVFLRVLEYFNGLLFLTTNRVDDIDEAIISRCIALLSYHSPGAEDRLKIWRVMDKQFSLEITEAQICQLVELFPRATGRDIKGLAKLVSKYCSHKNIAPSIEVFKRCSIFRGMEIA